MAASTPYLPTLLVFNDSKSFPLRMIDTLSMIQLKLFTYAYVHTHVVTYIRTPT